VRPTPAKDGQGQPDPPERTVDAGSRPSVFIRIRLGDPMYTGKRIAPGGYPARFLAMSGAGRFLSAGYSVYWGEERMKKMQITKEDFIRFQRLHNKQPWYLYLAIIIWLILVFAYFLFSAISQDNPLLIKLSYFLPLIAFVCVIYVMYKYVLPRNWMRLYEQNKELSLPFEMEVNEEGILVASELSRTMRPWKFFSKWKDDKELLLLYQADNMATIIRKNIFDDAEMRLIYAMIEKYKIPRFTSAIRINRTVALVAVVILVVLCVNTFVWYSINMSRK
jgi:hypothetical protein